MRKKEKYKYGLVGRNISYSFSRSYFKAKFEKEGITNSEYVNFDIETLEDFPNLLANDDNIKGFNVTIPYKESVREYVDFIAKDAEEIGAINTIKVLTDKKLKGYNTDVYGFELALKLKLKKTHQKALVFGTGGASKAVIYVLKKLKISYLLVSRNPTENQISYTAIDEELLKEYTLLINTTPLGTYPKTNELPKIPYKHLTPTHYLFDLVYNPPLTAFLKQGKAQGAIIQNGLKMLEYQAEKAWGIWQEK